MRAKIVLYKNELIVAFSIKRLFKSKKLKVKVNFDSEDAVNELIKKGGCIILAKDIDISLLSEKLTDIIYSKALLPGEYNIIPHDYKLTSREKEVLSLLIKGMTKQQTADHLSLSFHTVDSHLRNIYKKLKIKSKSQAIAKAINENLV